MLAAHPGRWRQADVLVASSPPLRAATGETPDADSEEWHRAWDGWFAQPPGMTAGRAAAGTMGA